MQFNWDYNRNQCVKEEEDIFLFDQIPGEVRLRIFNNHLFKDFVTDFKYLFNIRRNEDSGMQGTNLFIQMLKNGMKQENKRYLHYPFYSNQDS